MTTPQDMLTEATTFSALPNQAFNTQNPTEMSFNQNVNTVDTNNDMKVIQTDHGLVILKHPDKNVKTLYQVVHDATPSFQTRPACN